jgi:hypothetical protein
VDLAAPRAVAHVKNLSHDAVIGRRHSGCLANSWSESRTSFTSSALCGHQSAIGGFIAKIGSSGRRDEMGVLPGLGVRQRCQKARR